MIYIRPSKPTRPIYENILSNQRVTPCSRGSVRGSDWLYEDITRFIKEASEMAAQINKSDEWEVTIGNNSARVRDMINGHFGFTSDDTGYTTLPVWTTIVQNWKTMIFLSHGSIQTKRSMHAVSFEGWTLNVFFNQFFYKNIRIAFGFLFNR